MVLRLNSKTHCTYLETGSKWLQQFKFYGTVSNPPKEKQVNISLEKELSLKWINEQGTFQQSYIINFF